MLLGSYFDVDVDPATFRFLNTYEGEVSLEVRPTIGVTISKSAPAGSAIEVNAFGLK